MVTHTSANTHSAGEAALQGIQDGFAFDLYNYDGTSSIYIDNIVINSL